MLKLCGDKVVCFDVDDTLVFQDCPHDELVKSDIVLNWYGEKIPMWIHFHHVAELKELHSRGYVIIVWSQQGSDWCEAVVNAMGISNHVHFVIMKPEKMYDDLPLMYWSKIIYNKIKKLF